MRSSGPVKDIIAASTSTLMISILLDLSGYGAGVEDLNVRFGKMALAFLNGRAA